MKLIVGQKWSSLGCLLSVSTVLVLSACTSVSNKAPVVDRSGTGSSSSTPFKPSTVVPTTGEFYTVQRGDTLARIAVAHGKSWTELARLNNLTDPNQIEVGQQVRVRAAGTASGSSVSNTTKPSTTPVPSAPVAATITWQWPASGAASESFMGKNRGIDIKGSIGDPVYAAAAGKVMYSGNVRGYGNLVIIQHNGTFLTTYAHNKTLLVKEKETVKAGQKIAEMGDSDTTSPRLRFEVRQNGNPVDPLSFLPKR